MTEKTQEGNYTSSVRKILLEARRNASLLGAPATGSEHVLLALADRILVLCGGKVSGILPGRGASKREVGMMMTQIGGKADA